jgi:hypothetical protein
MRSRCTRASRLERSSVTDARPDWPIPKVSVRRAEPRDFLPLRDFYRRQHPHRPRLSDEHLQRWLFLDQPGSSERMPLFVLEVDGVVAGGIGYVATQVCAAGLTVELAFPVNYFIDERYRGLPALRLMRAVMGDCGALAGAYISDEARKLTTKMGFADRSREVRGFYYGIESAGSFKSRVLNRITRHAERMRHFWRLVRRAPDAHRVSDVLDEEFASRFNRIPGVIHPQKSARFIAWRYASSPSLRCRFIYQSIGSEPQAMAVVHGDRDGRSLVILDVLWCNHESYLLVSLIDRIIGFARENRYEMVVTQALSPRVRKALRACLFREAASDLGLVLFSSVKEVNEALSTSDNLHFMIGDTDAY